MSEPVGVFTPKTDDLMREASGQHVKVIRDFALPFAAVIVAGAIFSGALAAAIVSAAPVWLAVPLGVIAGGSAIAAIAVVRGLAYAQRVLVMIAYEFQSDHETQREIAKIAVNQIGPISQKGKGNTVVIGQSQTVEDVRLIPVRMASGKFIDSVPVEDVQYFCERAPLIGISRRSWFGSSLPSGRTINDYQIYDELVGVLVKAGLIIGRGERASGKLRTADSDEMKRVLGIEPGGTVKEVGTGAGESGRNGLAGRNP